MKKTMLIILASALMAQTAQAHKGPGSVPRNVASEEQISVEARAALTTIRQQAHAMMSSGQSEMTAEDLQRISAVTAKLSARQKLEVLQAAQVQLTYLSHYMAAESGSSEAAMGGPLVVNAVIAGCLTAIMFVNDDSSKPSMLRWIGVAVTAASIGGLVALAVRGNPEASRIENIAEELKKALHQAYISTMYQVQAEDLL